MRNEKKEELKDEMKNRISLALKDPILQQGFEIICKENAELKHQLEHRNCLDCSNHSSNLRMRNLDLEKENAELKTLIKSEHEIEARKNNRLIAQLTTAKELLKWWVSHCSNHDLYYAKKTEQFLNSEVEK